MVLYITAGTWFCTLEQERGSVDHRGNAGRCRGCNGAVFGRRAGSVMLHQWQKLATPHLGMSDSRPGVQVRGQQPPEDGGAVEIFSLCDVEEDGTLALPSGEQTNRRKDDDDDDCDDNNNVTGDAMPDYPDCDDEDDAVDGLSAVRPCGQGDATCAVWHDEVDNGWRHAHDDPLWSDCADGNAKGCSVM